MRGGVLKTLFLGRRALITCGNHNGAANSTKTPQLSSAIRHEPVARAIGNVRALASAGPA